MATRGCTDFGILALTAMFLFACAGGAEPGPEHAPKTETLANDPPPHPPDAPHPPDELVPPAGPEPWDPGRLPSSPEGALDVTPRGPNSCVAQLELTAELVGDEVKLRATLASNSDSSVNVTLHSPCPGGPVAFTGLGEGFDYYGTCNAGACQETDEPLTVFLPAGRGKVEIASTFFPISGDACRPPLEGGSHHLYGQAQVIAPEGATICGSAFTKLILPEAKKKARPPGATCPPQPVCALGCPSGGFARDENGCFLCACAGRRPGNL